MKSIECLERLFSIPKDCDHCSCNAECSFPNTSCDKLYETIKQDLDKIEKLELALEKAIEKCMKFDKCPPITCIEITKVITNDNVCKECWKKYFMKEVLKGVR